MAKKISPLLFRISNFNNYKNLWIFSYKINKNIIFLYNYNILNKLFKNLFLDTQFIYYNKIFIINIKFSNKINYKFFLNILYFYYNKFKYNIFIKIYKLIFSFYSIHFIKLFLINNIKKCITIQNLYQKLYIFLLSEYLNKNISFSGIKIIISGRLYNTELSKHNIFKFGTLALQYINIFIIYEQFFLHTKYGILGIKLWIGKLYNVY